MSFPSKVIASLILAISALLMFVRLGHYSLWDDEAVTALSAEGILRTGDTSVVLDHNVAAYRGGLLLSGTHERSTPPFSAYLTAPFVGLFGGSAFAVRFPFACFGVGSVALMLWWLYKQSNYSNSKCDPLSPLSVLRERDRVRVSVHLHEQPSLPSPDFPPPEIRVLVRRSEEPSPRPSPGVPGEGEKADWLPWLLMGMAIIGNVSFFLFSRQCRYYSPAIFSTIAIAYIYLNYDGRRWKLVLMALAGLVLLSSNYMNYLALHLCMLADYLIIGRKRRWLTLPEWLIVLLPQVVIGGVIFVIWNTLGTGNAAYLTANSFLERFELIAMNFRDMNVCEFGSGLLLLAAPIVYFITWRVSILRGLLVLIGYIVVVSLCSPQNVSQTQFADIRYVAPLIPLCMALGVMVLLEAARISKWLAIGIAAVAFGFNLFNGAFLWKPPLAGTRSTLIAWLGELWNPLPDPYARATEWLKTLPPGQSVWVQPDYMTYPLMYNAPHIVYAWQFVKGLPPAFQNLPPINVPFGAWPDYFLVVGQQAIQTVQPIIEQIRPTGNQYNLAGGIPVFWFPASRPELFWHLFTPIEMNDQLMGGGYAMYIFQRVSVPTTAPAATEHRP